ncbi:MAG TPA: hypothetical protein PK087_04060, partial [Bacilli bacterium]|nr:hypothetical protein [Bacilli bacterium]
MLSLDNWYKLNKIYATNSAFIKDNSYTKLGTFNSDFKRDFKRIREVMLVLTKENYEKRKTDAGLNRIRARKKFYQNIKLYEENNIKPTSFGDFHKSFKEWLYLEEIAVKKSNKPQNMAYINELKGFLNTIDIIKGKKADINQD